MSRQRRLACVVAAATSLIVAVGTLVGCHSDSPHADRATDAAGVPSAMRLADGNAGADWAGYGRTFGEDHFSPLTQINATNVKRLGLAWSIDLPAGNSVSAPIAIDGTLYLVTGYSVIHAVEAATGRELWQYDPKVYEVAGKKLRLAWGSRGLAWWDGTLYVGTQDGRLIAVNAKTGSVIWSTMTVRPEDTNYITGAPRVFDGKVIIGFGGADVGPARGYVSTYDAHTGALLWRWYTVPGNPADGFENPAMQMAARTWSGHWWEFGGGGTVWNAMSYDAETDTVFIGVGNGSPWNHKARSEGKGDNLFLASIVALDGKTGTYKWHYQVNPAETWDFTATNDLALAELEIGGSTRKVLMTVPKNGFFYVIDRQDGKLISAEPVAKVTWATHIDMSTGRPVENPAARYPDGKTAVVWPSNRGAHNWSPMAFSPQTGLTYIPVNEKGMSWTDDGVLNERWRQTAVPGSVQAAAASNLYPELNDPIDGTSKLLAWNPRTQKAAWSRATPGPLTGGVMATAGMLVFNGHLDGIFNAYAADSGEPLWSFQANAPVYSPPISYSFQGRQYVTVLTGFGAGAGFLGTPLSEFDLNYRTQQRRVLTFVLDGNASLPPKASTPLRPIDDPTFQPDKSSVDRGSYVFHRNCVFCHGIQAIAGGTAPDLRASPIILSQEAFTSIVSGGALLPAGMPRFAELDSSTLADLRMFFRDRARLWRAEMAVTNNAHAATSTAGDHRQTAQ